MGLTNETSTIRGIAHIGSDGIRGPPVGHDLSGGLLSALDVPIDGAHLGTLAGQRRRDSTSIAQQVMVRLTRPHHNSLLAFHASDHGDPFG
jgi:hypothetical protein